MKLVPILLSLCCAFASAQIGAPYRAPEAQTPWTFGAQSFSPALTGHLYGTQGGQDFKMDLASDAGLGKDKAPWGLFLDYQDPGIGFQVVKSSAEYTGDRQLGGEVILNGVSYPVGHRMLSRAKLTSLDAVWTMKFAGDREGWLGLDLGVQMQTLDLSAIGFAPQATTGTPSSGRVKASLPQAGLSGGGRGYNGAMEAKAFVHYMSYKGARYTLYGADVRVFPVRSFGLRAFYEGGRFSAPRGSSMDDLDVKLERKGMGVGAVVRF